MLIQEVTTIRTEDFPTQREWISKLLFPLNQFLLSAVTAVNGNITHGDNIPCVTANFVFVYGSESDFPRTFKYSLPSRPVEARICSATENGTPVVLGMAWYYDQNQVFVTKIVKFTSEGTSTLTRGATYNIVVRALP